MNPNYTPADLRIKAGARVLPCLRNLSCSAIATALLLAPIIAGAQPAQSSASTNTTARLKFRPPSSGAPSVRLTGGSRGTGQTAVALEVLAPDDVGLTTREQPSLYWYQSKPTTAKFEVTVIEENKVKPLVQVMVDRAVNSGIQRLRLADHGVKLAKGVEYQWVVALIPDPENRSNDLVASGVIKRVEASPDLNKSIATATADALAGIYAEAGIWYDALSAISDRVDAEPGNKTLQEARADLLRQVGLNGTFVASSR